MSFLIRPSNVRVCRFRHPRTMGMTKLFFRGVGGGCWDGRSRGGNRGTHRWHSYVFRDRPIPPLGSQEREEEGRQKKRPGHSRRDFAYKC